MIRELSRERLRALALMDRIEAGEKVSPLEWMACFFGFVRARSEREHPDRWR